MKWDKEYEEYVINDNYDYDVEDYKLTTLCDYYQIRDNSFAHRALSDAFATGLLFKCLAQDKIDY
jgi:DNA polymerase III epsilon subunit-like protein